MIEETEKNLLEQNVPRRSLADNKTWLGLLDSIENIRYSTKTIFKVSGKYLIKAVYRIEPIFLYDNIILGKRDGRLAFLCGGEFKYSGNQLLLEAINQKGYNLAKLVFGSSVAGFVFDGLIEKYKKAFDVDEYCDLVHLAYQFELCQLNSTVSQWLCKFLNGQVALEEAPTELRTANFQFWESVQFPGDVLRYQGEKDCTYSIGCFLENVLSG